MSGTPRRALLLALAGAPAAAAPAAPVVATLDNGLEVVIEVRRAVPEAVVLLRLPFGSRDEAPGAWGTAHLLEHLVFEGSAAAPDRGLERTVQGAGGQCNAWTGPDETVLYDIVPVGALDATLFLEADRMGALLPVAPADLANQQDVVLRERAEWAAAPRGAEIDLLTGEVWPPGHPYHHPVIGTPATVRGATAPGLHALHAARHGPRGAVLAVVGDVDPEDVLEKVRAHFGALPGPPPPPRATAPLLGPQPRKRVWATGSGPAWVLSWTWRGPPAGHPDAAALALVPALLSNGQGTLLDDGAFALADALTSDASWWEGALGGQLTLSISLGAPRLPRAAATITAALAALAEAGPSPRALARAQAVHRHALEDSLDDPLTRAHWRAWCRARGRAATCEREVLAALDAVRPEDVQRALAAWTGPDRGVQLSTLPPGATGGALAGARQVVLP